MKWLVDHGIAKDRLSSAGFGPDRPLDSNETEIGRQNNRRVEFHIQSGTPAVPIKTTP
jgi:outer membrane protein OmpA-like peptidoglycan-associated protein